jgi:hypothetical protein
MDKSPSRSDPHVFVRATQALAAMGQHRSTSARDRTPSLDRGRARQACAPMGVLHSIVVTVDARKRRRTWYVIDPDFALAVQYAAAGFDLTPGCKVLIDAEAMRPVALLDADPIVAPLETGPMPHGFNPYFDLPAG